MIETLNIKGNYIKVQVLLHCRHIVTGFQFDFYHSGSFDVFPDAGSGVFPRNLAGLIETVRPDLSLISADVSHQHDGCISGITFQLQQIMSSRVRNIAPKITGILR